MNFDYRNRLGHAFTSQINEASATANAPVQYNCTNQHSVEMTTKKPVVLDPELKGQKKTLTGMSNRAVARIGKAKSLIQEIESGEAGLPEKKQELLDAHADALGALDQLKDIDNWIESEIQRDDKVWKDADMTKTYKGLFNTACQDRNISGLVTELNEVLQALEKVIDVKSPPNESFCMRSPNPLLGDENSENMSSVAAEPRDNIEAVISDEVMVEDCLSDDDGPEYANDRLSEPNMKHVNTRGPMQQHLEEFEGNTPIMTQNTGQNHGRMSDMRQQYSQDMFQNRHQSLFYNQQPMYGNNLFQNHSNNMVPHHQPAYQYQHPMYPSYPPNSINLPMAEFQSLMARVQRLERLEANGEEPKINRSEGHGMRSATSTKPNSQLNGKMESTQDGYSGPIESEESEPTDPANDQKKSNEGQGVTSDQEKKPKAYKSQKGGYSSNSTHSTSDDSELSDSSEHPRSKRYTKSLFKYNEPAKPGYKSKSDRYETANDKSMTSEESDNDKRLKNNTQILLNKTKHQKGSNAKVGTPSKSRMHESEYETANTDWSGMENNQRQWSKVKLKPFELEKFSGKHSYQYKDWRAMFMNLYGKNPTVDTVSKLIHLKTFLSDGARTLVDPLPLNPSNFKVAMKILDENFLDDEKILEKLQNDFLDFQIEQKDAAKMMLDVNKLATLVFQMENEKGVIDQPYIYQGFIRKLPEKIRRKVMEKTNKKSFKGDFRKAYSWIKEEVRMELKMKDSMSRFGNENPKKTSDFDIHEREVNTVKLDKNGKNNKKGQVQNALLFQSEGGQPGRNGKTNNNKKVKPCCFHNSDENTEHSRYRCKKTSAECFYIAKLKNLCICCTEPGHRHRDCPQKGNPSFKCRVSGCQASHATMFHEHLSKYNSFGVSGVPDGRNPPQLEGQSAPFPQNGIGNKHFNPQYGQGQRFHGQSYGSQNPQPNQFNQATQHQFNGNPSYQKGPHVQSGRPQNGNASGGQFHYQPQHGRPQGGHANGAQYQAEQPPHT